MSHPRDILLSLGAAARKSLSQNFLTSPHWAETLTRGVLQESNVTEIWEIGPGLGALTQVLAKKAKVPVRLFEYDKKLSQYLREQYPTLTLHEGDVLKAPLEKLALDAKKINVVSNLPYHLSSPVLFRLIDLKPHIHKIVLTFQKEFSDRLLAGVGQEAYGALSVIASLHFKMESLGTLPPGAFYPPPSIASEALMLEPKAEKKLDLEQITKIVKASFTQPRKKMAGNLKKAFPKVEWEKHLVEMGLSGSVRAEELSQKEFITLSERVQKEKTALT